MPPLRSFATWSWRAGLSTKTRSSSNRPTANHGCSELEQ